MKRRDFELYFKIEQNRQVASSGLSGKRHQEQAREEKKELVSLMFEPNNKHVIITFQYISIFPPVHWFGDENDVRK